MTGPASLSNWATSTGARTFFHWVASKEGCENKMQGISDLIARAAMEIHFSIALQPVIVWICVAANWWISVTWVCYKHVGLGMSRSCYTHAYDIQHRLHAQCVLLLIVHEVSGAYCPFLGVCREMILAHVVYNEAQQAWETPHPEPACERLEGQS